MAPSDPLFYWLSQLCRPPHSHTHIAVGRTVRPREPGRMMIHYRFWDKLTKDTKFVLVAFSFFFFWPLHVARGISVLPPGIKPVTPALEAQTVNLLTTGQPGKSPPLSLQSLAQPAALPEAGLRRGPWREGPRLPANNHMKELKPHPPVPLNLQVTAAPSGRPWPLR